MAVSVRALSSTHGGLGSGPSGKELEAQVAEEYEAHKKYLQRTFAALKAKFKQDVGLAQQASTQAMRGNMTLIRDINAAREQNRATKHAISNRAASMQRMRALLTKSSKGRGGSLRSGSYATGPSQGGGSVSPGGGLSSQGGPGGHGGGSGGGSVGPGGVDEAAVLEMAANRERIASLRGVVARLEAQLELVRIGDLGTEALMGDGGNPSPRHLEAQQGGGGGAGGGSRPGSSRGAPPILPPVEGARTTPANQDGSFINFNPPLE